MRILSIVFLILLSGCAVKNRDLIVLDINQTEQVKIDEKWWLGYNEPVLNELIDKALRENIDISKAILNIRKALARVGVSEAAQQPTLGASFGANTSRNLSINDSFASRYSNNFTLNYELDIWGKLANETEALKFEASANKWDKKALELSVINSVIDSYFHILYLNESLKLYTQNLKNYNDLLEISNIKVKNGKDEAISLKQIKSQILNIQNRIINANISLDNAKQTLRNLLNLRPDYEFEFKDSLDVELIGVNLDVPIYAISNRPDLNAAIDRINSALLDVKVSKKSFYPSISLGASLSDSDDKFNKSFGFNILGGNVSINLPFLNYKRLKQNLIISEVVFESMKLEYEKTLTSALNEINTAYKQLKNDKILYKNYKTQINNYEDISEIYRLKQEYGKIEMRDYLNAKNNEIEAKITLINQKYKILSDENMIYKAMAGKIIFN